MLPFALIPQCCWLQEIGKPNGTGQLNGTTQQKKLPKSKFDLQQNIENQSKL